MDSNKAFFDWRGDGPNKEPRYGLFYLTVIPFSAAVGFVAWLGWDWPALVLTVAVAVLVAGGMLWRWSGRRSSGSTGGDSSADPHRDARTSTLESQKRMNLDSKGPLG